MSGDTIDWIRLANARINVAEYRRLAERFGTVRDVTRQAAVTLESAGLNPTKARALADPDPAAGPVRARQSGLPRPAGAGAGGQP